MISLPLLQAFGDVSRAWDLQRKNNLVKPRPGDWSPGTDVERWVHSSWWMKFHPNFTEPQYLYFLDPPKNVGVYINSEGRATSKCAELYGPAPDVIPAFEQMCDELRLPTLDRHNMDAARPYLGLMMEMDILEFDRIFLQDPQVLASGNADSKQESSQVLTQTDKH